MTASPYQKPGFYDRALADGKHRDIVGGRWEETGNYQMELLQREGLTPADRFLDIGAGSLRLGCQLVPWLDPGNYWATDASRALMLRGYDVELGDKARLDPERLIEDDSFALPGVPADIDIALCFAVFTHLPQDMLQLGLGQVRTRLPHLRKFLFTVFIAPDAQATGPFRQVDGVVTHPSRTPFHFTAQTVSTLANAAGWAVEYRGEWLPRGQVLCVATPI